MNKQLITFSASEQSLYLNSGVMHYSSNKVSYIQAHFDLGQNWTGYDSVRAVWFTQYACISTVLDGNGDCIVPYEVLKIIATVKVNLVGSISDGGTLTDRITTYPVRCIEVDEEAKVCGSETQPITPSQFEQFVSIVNEATSEVINMRAVASTLPAGSDATASYNEGVLYLGIPQGAKGDKGDQGVQGETGDAGVGIASIVQNANYTLTINLDDGRSYTTTSIRGEKGATGATPNISIGTVETLEPNESATASMSGTAENPVLNLGIPQGRQGEVTLSQLESVLPTDTAQGSIASFSDGCDLFNAKSVVIGIEPIQSGSGTPSPDNIRPISGWTGAEVNVSGFNAWDEEWENGAYYVDSGNKLNSSVYIRNKNRTKVLPNTTYYLSVPSGDTDTTLLWYDADNNYTGTYRTIGTSGAFTVPSGVYGFDFYTKESTYNNDISINYPSTDHEYHAYHGTTYPISWQTEAGTVYGGTLDVVSGVLTVDKVMVTFDGTEYWGSTSGFVNRFRATVSANASNENQISNYLTKTDWGVTPYTFSVRDTYLYVSLDTNASQITVDEFKAYLSAQPLQVCYELATPQTYQLTPTDIALLQGQNNVWADTGDTEVTYKADIQGYIDKKINALI